MPHGFAQFDHGAQYFTVRDPAFERALHAAGAALGEWHGEFVSLEATHSATLRAEQRWVGVPSMNAVAAAMATGLQVRSAARVSTLRRSGGGLWRIGLADGTEPGPFDAVVVAVPAEQACVLLAMVDPAMAEEAQRARTAPCWAGMFAFHGPTVSTFDAIRFRDHPVLAWAASDSSKPHRPDALLNWVAHARTDWSREHLESEPAAIAALLRDALLALFDAPRPSSQLQRAHLWRYAQVEAAAGTAFAWNPGLRLGACGDWRLGARVELAWQSGDALAQVVS